MGWFLDLDSERQKMLNLIEIPLQLAL